MANKTTAVVFMRPGSFGSIDTLAVYEFTHSPRLKTQEDVLEAIRSAVTAWVTTTKEGKEAWEDSSDDMNIGDIGGDPPLSLRRLLKQEGITGWTCVCQVGDLDTVPYDTVLVDESQLDDDDMEI